MSEMEQLKKAADESKAKQIVSEVSAYLSLLDAQIDYSIRRKKDSFIVYVVAWIAWVISGFFVDTSIEYGFLVIFVLTLAYDSFRFAQLRRAFGEYMGAVEVLRILGYIRSSEDGDRQKRKREIYKEGMEMVKRWFSDKKEAQEKVYAPA